MAETIDGYWDKPILKSKNVALVVAGIAFLVCICALHDAYDVRGSDRPFLLKIMGMPQL